LTKDFTALTKVAQIKTYPVSHKLSLNQDKSTYTSGEQEQVIEFSSFSMCSTLQAWQVIKQGLAERFITHFYSS
jgi:hypothetical protein